MARVSTLDPDYITGGLSKFPESTDDKDSLYEVANNAETKLRSSLAYNGKMIIVESTEGFPEKGLIRIGPAPGNSGAAELVYYDSKTKETFKDLSRGFAGSRQNQWPAGSWVVNSVMAEPHNAIKDAIINMENYLGLESAPEAGSLNYRLKLLEAKFLSPKPSFRAFPKKGFPGATIRFQNFSDGDIVRYLWEFGDGTQSSEKNPIHTYSSEGIFTVKLSIITSTGGQGTCTKRDYVKISLEEKNSFFYVDQTEGNSISSGNPTNFRFVDQTDNGLIPIKQRFWIFGDGVNEVAENPNEHEITHKYQNPGIYEPSLLVVFANETLKKVYLTGLKIKVN